MMDKFVQETVFNKELFKKGVAVYIESYRDSKKTGNYLIHQNKGKELEVVNVEGIIMTYVIDDFTNQLKDCSPYTPFEIYLLEMK